MFKEFCVIIEIVIIELWYYGMNIGLGIRSFEFIFCFWDNSILNVNIIFEKYKMLYKCNML